MAFRTSATVMTWTNTAGGSFGTAANWSPNAVPGGDDVAFITTAGTYTVTLDTARIVGGVQLGTPSGTGTQTFSTGGNALTLSRGSSIQASGEFTLAANLNISGITFTNNGTVTWIAGTITDGGSGVIENNGLWDARGDNTFVFSGANYSPAFNNNPSGVLRKSGGSGTTAFGSSFYFNNAGLVDVQTGTLSTWNGSSAAGTFNAASGATLRIDGDFTVNSGSQFTGTGVHLLANGTFTLNGNITFSTLEQTGGRLAGNHVLNGIFKFTGGDWYSQGGTTLAQGSTLNITSGLNLSSRSLTNNGTVTWTAGTITNGISAAIANNGLWDAQGDNTFAFSGANYSPAFYNNPSGILRKSGGSGTTAFGGNFYFNNAGLVDVQTGTLSTWSGSSTAGTFNAESGATLRIDADFTLNSGSQFTGAGVHLLTNGRFTLNGNITFSTLEQTGGTLAGNHVLNGAFKFTGGDWYSYGGTTLAQGSTLTINSGLNLAYRSLTNNGTVTWTAGTITDGNSAVIENNGLWDAQGDNTFAFSGANYSPAFNNNPAGILRKSGGTGTTAFGPSFYFNNAGLVDVQTGTLSTWIGSSAAGTFNTASGATLRIDADFTFNSGSQFTGAGAHLLANGTFTLNGNITFSTLEQTGGRLAGSHVLNGAFKFTGGDWYSQGGTTLAEGGTLTITSGLNLSYRSLTNNGTVTWTAGTITGGDGAVIYNKGLWDAQADAGFTHSEGAPCVFNNSGIFRKSGGTGTTAFSTTTFNNAGTSDVQSGTLSWPYAYNLAKGTIRIGINGLTDYGRLSLGGAANLTGTLSANLNGGYIPVAGSAFPIITYASSNGTFTAYSLPDINAWTNSANATTFTLTVLNSRPILPAVPLSTSVDELTTLTMTNTATDLDVPANTLTYELVAPPSGASIDGSGVITWTPTEAQGPSTNIITTVVTDNGSPALSATNSFVVVVNEVNVAPVINPISDVTVNPGQPVSLTASATDVDLPANTLTFSLISSPAGAGITPGTGLISWRPPVALADTTNLIQVRVRDQGSPDLSATNSFNVVVRPLSPVVLTPVGYSNGVFSLQVTGVSGPDYIITTSTNLQQWLDVETNSPTTFPFEYIDTNALGNFRAYRVRLAP